MKPLIMCFGCSETQQTLLPNKQALLLGGRGTTHRPVPVRGDYYRSAVQGLELVIESAERTCPGKDDARGARQESRLCWAVPDFPCWWSAVALKNFFDVTVRRVREREMSALYWAYHEEEGLPVGDPPAFLGTATVSTSWRDGSSDRLPSGSKFRTSGGRLSTTENLHLTSVRTAHAPELPRTPCLPWRSPHLPAAALPCSRPFFTWPQEERLRHIHRAQNSKSTRPLHSCPPTARSPSWRRRVPTPPGGESRGQKPWLPGAGATCPCTADGPGCTWRARAARPPARSGLVPACEQPWRLRPCRSVLVSPTRRVVGRVLPFPPLPLACDDSTGTCGVTTPASAVTSPSARGGAFMDLAVSSAHLAQVCEPKFG